MRQEAESCKVGRCGAAHLRAQAVGDVADVGWHRDETHSNRHLVTKRQTHHTYDFALQTLDTRARDLDGTSRNGPYNRPTCALNAFPHEFDLVTNVMRKPPLPRRHRPQKLA